MPVPAWGAVDAKELRVENPTGKFLRDDGCFAEVEGGPSGSVDWADVENKPSVFPPSTHNHDALYSLLAHHHDASYAGINHNHTGVYSPVAHHHDSAYAPIAHVSAANPHSGHEVVSMKGQANGYASLGADGKVPSAQLPAQQGGSDPWTYLKITAADFTTSSATAVDITGLGWTPLANTWYEFHGMLWLRTATATVNPRAGLAWSTGLTDGVGRIEQAQAAATAPLNANGNIAASLLIAVGGLPNTTQSWPATAWGSFRSGASPSGNVRLQLASETAGTVVRATIGSFLRYRVIP